MIALETIDEKIKCISKQAKQYMCNVYAKYLSMKIMKIFGYTVDNAEKLAIDVLENDYVIHCNCYSCDCTQEIDEIVKEFMQIEDYAAFHLHSGDVPSLSLNDIFTETEIDVQRKQRILSLEQMINSVVTYIEEYNNTREIIIYLDIKKYDNVFKEMKLKMMTIYVY